LLKIYADPAPQTGGSLCKSIHVRISLPFQHKLATGTESTTENSLEHIQLVTHAVDEVHTLLNCVVPLSLSLNHLLQHDGCHAIGERKRYRMLSYVIR